MSERRIQHQVRARRRQCKVAEAVAPGAVQPGARDDCLDAIRVLCSALLAGGPVRRGEHGRFFEPGAGPHFHAPLRAIGGIQRAAIAVTDQRQSRGRVGDDAEHRPETGAVVALQRDQRAEQEAVGDEGARAVDRIQYPSVAVAGLGPVLLTDDAVVRIAPLDQLAHRRLGGAIGQRHRRSVFLGVDRGAGQEVATDRRERGADQLVRERHELGFLGTGERGTVASWHHLQARLAGVNSPSHHARSASAHLAVIDVLSRTSTAS